MLTPEEPASGVAAGAVVCKRLLELKRLVECSLDSQVSADLYWHMASLLGWPLGASTHSVLRGETQRSQRPSVWGLSLKIGSLARSSARHPQVAGEDATLQEIVSISCTTPRSAVCLGVWKFPVR